jgi:hypothetical protein
MLPWRWLLGQTLLATRLIGRSFPPPSTRFCWIFGVYIRNDLILDFEHWNCLKFMLNPRRTIGA